MQPYPDNAPLKAKRTEPALWLLALGVLYTLYFAQTLLLPVVVTSLIALMLSPLVGTLQRAHVPRTISAFLLVSTLIAPFTFLASELAEPAQKWAKLVPELTQHLTEQIDSLSDAMDGKNNPTEVQTKENESFSFFGLFDEKPSVAKAEPSTENTVTQRIKQGGMELMISMLATTPMILAQLATGIILTLFLLIFGPSLFEAFIQYFPKITDKGQVRNLVATIQKELSRYIVTVSIINAGLGLSTALTLYFIGIEDALLWGVLAGMLNFIPYVGSLIGATILTLAGLVQFGVQLTALIPPGVYFLLNLVESQFITPTVLGRNMQLNPLIVVLWLLVWGWLWGAVGVLLAVPLLVCIKLALDQLNIWTHWLKIIEA
ncbi:AI-2E family transporter [uncultured Paraglaciecola sp.]|uniref:AI-2E family transporter n=1 Tax=uncultured Paraglaciecola sp. TaxID=1765024 RepID=UPI0030DAE759|tara:strand:- start:77932 stop:79056 length:1125 start_codon:yes stop_codon:yes gene_type:complete